MTRLVVTELYRMWSRRLLKVLGALLLLGIVAVGVVTFVQSGRDVTELQGQADRERQREVESCVRGDFNLPGQNRPGFDRRKRCERIVGEFQVADPRFRLVYLPEVLMGVSPLAAILCLLLGASFVGAEWQKGSMTTALTWEPRRVRLLIAKFVAVALFGLVFVVFMQLLLSFVLAIVAVTVGSTGGVNPDWARETSGVAARVAALGSITAVVGSAIATMGRNTTAALGAAFVYFGVLEGLIRGLRPKWQPWLLGDNASQFISGQPAGETMLSKTQVEVALTLLAYVAVLTIAATSFFKTRDVT